MNNTIKDKVKLALRITTTTFDGEIDDLIAAAKADLEIAGVSREVTRAPEAYPLVLRAIVSYCKLHFGEPSDPVRLRDAYEWQRMQLARATGYTDYGGGANG